MNTRRLSLIALVVGCAVVRANDAHAQSYAVATHGIACVPIAPLFGGSGQNGFADQAVVYDQFGVHNPYETQDAEVLCPFSVAMTAFTGITQVTATYWNESGNPVSCTVNITDNAGFVQYSNTQTSTAQGTTPGTFTWNITAGYNYGYLDCTLPAWGTEYYRNYLASYEVTAN